MPLTCIKNIYGVRKCRVLFNEDSEPSSNREVSYFILHTINTNFDEFLTVSYFNCRKYRIKI